MQDNKRDMDEYGANIPPSNGEEVSDDDLDLSQLLEKYMLEPQYKTDDTSEKSESDADPGEAIEELNEEKENDIADDIGSAIYREFASDVYSDDEARLAAAKDAAVLDDYISDVNAENDGIYRSDKEVEDVLGSFDPNSDYSYDDGVFGDNEDDGYEEAVTEEVAEAIENVGAEDSFDPAEESAEAENFAESVGNAIENDYDPDKDVAQYPGFADEFAPAAGFVPEDSSDFGEVPARVDDLAPEEVSAYGDADALAGELAPEEISPYGYSEAPADGFAPEERSAYIDDDALSGEFDPEGRSVHGEAGSVGTPATEEYAPAHEDAPAAPVEEAALAEGDGNEGLFVDGSEFADELADLSAFAEGDEQLNSALTPPEEQIAPEAAAEAPEEETAEEPLPDFVDYEAKEEHIDIDENVDSTDINLMLAFGLDDELERTMGAENARRLTRELDEEQRKRVEHARKTVDNEYMNRSQTAGIAQEYKKRYRSVRIKLAFAALISIALFMYENLALFGIKNFSIFDPKLYPTVYIMGSLQLLLFAAAFAYEQIFEGFARLFKGKPDHRSVTAIALVAAVVYNAVLPSVTTIADEPIIINFAVALLVIFTLVAEYYNVRREIFSFNIVSSKKPKHVITKGGIAEAGFDSNGGEILKFETASFVDGFFTRTKEPVAASKSYALSAIVISLIAAAVCGAATNIFNSDSVNLLGGVVENSFCGFFIALPVSMMIASSYPFYRASRSAYDIDGAIIGECSLEEYSDAGCVTFDDVGVFPSYGVRVQNVKIYNNHRIDRVLYYAASVFSVARGPLTDVFDMATVEIGHSDDVRIRAAGSGYLSATVDDRNITFGSAAELITRGFDIPEAVTDEDDFDEEDVSVMYMFREDRLMAKLFIKYSIDADFETIMASLCEEGITVSIKTYDPNIDRDLIAAGLTNKDAYAFSVTRYDGADDGSNVRDNAESGIVSRSSAKTLLQLISECTKVLASRRSATVIGTVSAIVAAIMLVVVIATGKASEVMPGRISAFAAAYQIFWMIPVYISAKIHVR